MLKFFQLFSYTSLFFSIAGFSQSRLESVEQNLAASQSLARQQQNQVESLQRATENRNFTGIEILVADQLDRIASLAGHAFVRLTDNDSDAFNDLTIGFEMLIVNPGQEYEKALSGGWENSITISTLGEAIARYGRSEGRGLTRYILPSTAKNRSLFIEYIKSIIWVPDLVGDYNFISNNCFTALLKVLSAAGFNIEKSSIKVPLLSETILKFNFLLQYPGLRVTTAQDEVDKIMAEYSAIYNQSVGCWRALSFFCGLKKDNYSYLSDPRFWKIIESLNNEQLQKLYFFWPDRWKSRLAKMAILIRNRIETTSPIETLLKLQTIPQINYQTCQLNDQDCRTQRWRSALTIWSREQILKVVKFYPASHRQEMLRAKTLIPPVQEETLGKLNSLPVRDSVISAYELLYLK